MKPLVMRIERGATVNAEWRQPGDIVELYRVEEARALVRHGIATPANLRTFETLGDCRAPKQRAADQSTPATIAAPSRS